MKKILSLILLTTLWTPLTVSAAEGDPAGTENSSGGDAVTPAPEPENQPAIASADLLEQQKQADIAARQTPETEVFWLDAGEQKRLALYLPSVEPQAHAGVIIFPDTTTSADWPDFIHPLRTALTEHGWSTLTLNLPPEQEAEIPRRTLPTRLSSNTLQQDNSAAEATADPAAAAETPSESTPQTEGAGATDAEAAPEMKNDTATATAPGGPAYPELIGELSTAALQVIAEKGHERQIIMGVGNGAVWATQLFLSQASDSQSLVLIDPRNSFSAQAPALTSLISELQAPALDLWFDSSPSARQDAALRKRVARRNNATDYIQIRINRRVDAVGKHPQWLTKQVRGILESRILKQPRAMPVQPTPDTQLTPGG